MNTGRVGRALLPCGPYVGETITQNRYLSPGTKGSIMSLEEPLFLSRPFLGKAPSWRSNRPLMSNEAGQTLARAIVDTIREPLLVLDNDLRVVLASRSFYMTFKMAREDVQGRSVFELGDGQWNI